MHIYACDLFFVVRQGKILLHSVFSRAHKGQTDSGANLRDGSAESMTLRLVFKETEWLPLSGDCDKPVLKALLSCFR